VPARSYDDFVPWIDAIREGKQQVLTADTVTLLEPTSGSTGAEKLIPYTASLQRQIRRAVAVWTTRLFLDDPTLLGGPSYWSLTPQMPAENRPDSIVPIGFDDDGAYLGAIAERLLGLTMVTRPGLKRLDDMDEFWSWSLLLLLSHRDLQLVSVWHPSFLAILLDRMAVHWDALLDALARGAQHPRAGLSVKPAARRARELAGIGPGDPLRIWPRLRLISCWCDAHAALSVAEIRRRMPGVEIQGKGLVATEGIVTIPVGAHYPLALRSHFFEFVDEQDQVYPAWQLARGRIYTVLLTTGGGLYRYRLRDRVEVTDFLGDTPCLRFVGKADAVSDRYGEKLSAAHVGDILQRLLQRHSLEPGFAMLAPESSGEMARYELYCDAVLPEAFAAELDESLRENPHYELCRRLGQLGPIAVVTVPGDAAGRFLERMGAAGGRLGDVKPTPLSDLDGWRGIFRAG
jgi:hypothetical protein